ELGPLVVEERGRGVTEGLRLLLDRGDDLRVAVPEVDRDEPAPKIEVLLPVGVEDVRTLAPNDDRCRKTPLREPWTEDVFRVFGLELGGGHGARSLGRSPSRGYAPRASHGAPLRFVARRAVPKGMLAALMSKRGKNLLAIDQGTTGSTAIVLS